MFSNKILKKQTMWLYATVCLLCAVFLFILISQSLPYPELPPSPDGVANLTFAERISEGHSILIDAPNDIPSELQKFFIPRSTVYYQDFHAIGLQSYYGLPIFISIWMKVLSLHLIYFLVAIIGIFSVGYIVKKMEISRISKASIIVLFIFNPFFLFYAVNGHMHNLLFLNLLLSTSALSLFLLKNKYTWPFIFPGILLALAIATRMNEIVWAIPFFVVLLVILAKQQVFKKMIYAAIGFIFGLLPFIAIGYSTSNSITQYRTTSTEMVQQSASSFSVIKQYLLPFGFDLANSFINFYTFAISIWWLTIPGLIACAYLIYYCARKRIKKSLFIIISVIAVFLFLILYYGPTATDYYSENIVIGYSHFRYLLPLFVLFPLFIPLAVEKMPGKYKKLIIMGLTACMVTGSGLYLFFSDASLENTRLQNIVTKQRVNKIVNILEDDAVVIAGRGDKYFFPKRMTAGTIIHSRREQFTKTLVETTVQEPVYYYHIEADISSHWTKDALEEAGVEFTYVTKFFDGGNAWEYLYKLDWPNKEKYGE